jgi:hypothetical protein
MTQLWQEDTAKSSLFAEGKIPFPAEPGHRKSPHMRICIRSMQPLPKVAEVLKAMKQEGLFESYRKIAWEQP